MKTTSIKYLAAALVVFTLTTSARADFGAIAYSPSTGSWGTAYGQGSRSDAEYGAKGRCGRTDARIAVWVQNGWAAMAIGDDGKRGWGWSGSSLSEAKSIAIQNAGRNASVRCWVYSGR